MKLRWMPHSILDLHAIYEYIAEDSPINALSTIERILSREEQIMSHPISGRMVPEFQMRDIREIIEGDYRIIYRTKIDRVDILTVMHGSRLLREIPGVS